MPYPDSAAACSRPRADPPRPPARRPASERAGQGDGERLRRRGDAPRDRARRPRPRHHQPQPGRRLRRSSTPTGEVVGEGFHASPAGRTPRSTRCAQAGERARGGTARGHPRTLQPHRPHRPLRPGADRGRRRPRRVSPSPTPTRTPPAAPPPCAPPGSRSSRGTLADEAEAGNAAWLTSVRRGRPYVIWKYAATLDGRIAAADGTSRWITSAEARADVHRLRGTVDAVIVGSGTVRADDPQLTARNCATAAWPSGSRCGSSSTARRVPRAGARVLDGAAPTLIASRGRRPAAGRSDRRLPRRRRAGPAHALLAGAARARRALGAAGGRPHAGRGLPRRRPGRQGRRLPRPRAARRRPRRPGRRRNHHHRRGVATRRHRRHARLGPDLRITASAPPRGRTEMFTGIVEELGEVVAVDRTARRRRPARRARPRRHRGRQARRLHRRQRRLPHRRGRRGRRVSPPT